MLGRLERGSRDDDFGELNGDIWLVIYDDIFTAITT
jgi:hypothetical protein